MYVTPTVPNVYLFKQQHNASNGYKCYDNSHMSEQESFKVYLVSSQRDFTTKTTLTATLSSSRDSLDHIILFLCPA